MLVIFISSTQGEQKLLGTDVPDLPPPPPFTFFPSYTAGVQF